LQQLFLGTLFSKGRRQSKARVQKGSRFSQVSLPDAIGCFNLPLLIIPYHPYSEAEVVGDQKATLQLLVTSLHLVTNSLFSMSHAMNMFAIHLMASIASVIKRKRVTLLQIYP